MYLAKRFSFASAIAVVFVLSLHPGGLRAQSGVSELQTTGDIASLALDRPDDPESGAVMVVGGQQVVIPSSVSIALPAASVRVRDLFEQAQDRCRKVRQSGLAQRDACRSYPAENASDGGQASPAAKATVVATQMSDGRLVATSVAIDRNNEEYWGAVTFVNEAAGYVRVNGALREDDGGTIMRINDPFKQLSDQNGQACGGEGNCSPDLRFRLDPAQPSVRFERGNPACIGGDAQGCAAANRDVPAEDVTSHVPIRVGDNIKAEGVYEYAGGVRYFSAQALLVQTTLPSDR